MEYDPRSQVMDMLKGLCLLSTIVTLIITYRLYLLSELFERLVVYAPISSCRANTANMIKLRPESGLGLVKVLQCF